MLRIGNMIPNKIEFCLLKNIFTKHNRKSKGIRIRYKICHEHKFVFVGVTTIENAIHPI